MKKILLYISVVLLVTSCQEPRVESIDPNTFTEQVRDKNDIQIVDTRTPAEFDMIHMKNAVNIDYQNSDWKKELSKLDKNKPVYLYCLSGSRSAEMMQHMREEGFKEVYNLEGGLATLNEDQINSLFDASKLKKQSSSADGMNEEQLNAFIAEHKNVVVDFYADWCGPCKVMDPHLKELAEKNKDKFTLLKVNFDQSRELAKKFNIRGIPHLLIYKDGELVDRQEGFSTQMLEQFKTKILTPYL